MGHNKSSKVNGIKMILKKNYGVEIDLIDVNSLVDNGLSYSENYGKIYNECKKLRLIRRGGYIWVLIII